MVTFIKQLSSNSMKVIFLILLTIFSIYGSYGQITTRNAHVVKEIGIEDIKTSKRLNHIRLWWGCRAVEVWMNIDSSIAGSIICYGIEYYNAGGTSSNVVKKKYYSSIYTLQKLQAKEVYQRIIKSNILNIDSSLNIEGWNSNWVDSYSYEIETSFNRKYQFKNYVNPRGQDTTISEARLLDNFFNTLFEELEMKSYWNRFVDSLPVGHEYTFDNYSIVKQRKNR